jgi:peptide/nickel transport system substrate-binding protein
MEIRVLEWTTFLSQYIDKRDFDAYLLGWSLTLDPDSYAIWHSSQAQEHQMNYPSYVNPEVDRLLVEGRAVLDQGKRQTIYRRIHRLIYDDQPYTFLYVPYALSSVHKRFKGLSYHRFGGVGWHTENWYVPTTQQKYQALP